MSETTLFRQQLTSSADGLVWAVDQIPTGRYDVIPLPDFGTWSVARIMFHEIWYERNVALPYLRFWYGAASAPDFSGYAEDQEEQDWLAAKRDMPGLLAQFRALNDALVSLLETDEALEWHEARETVFGDVTLYWLMMKTYQSRVEQTDTLLRMALYWDLYLQDLENERLREGRRKENPW